MNYNIAGKLIKWCWIVALCGVAGFNCQPYLEFARDLAAQASGVPFSGLIEPIPIAGDVAAMLWLILPDLITVCVFLVIQGLQCLPMLLANPNVVRARIAAGEQWQQLPIKASDPKWLADLKTRLNNFPLEWIENIHKGSKVAYAVDVVFGAIKYPLFTAGWLNAVQNWNTLDLSAVNWSNVPAFVIMLFAMEFAIWIYLKLAEGVDIFNASPAAPLPQQPAQDVPLSW